jgi:hypothetical protein
MDAAATSNPPQQPPELDGCAVVSNTMVCEAARRISGLRLPRQHRTPPWLRGVNIFADLLSLIDCVVLHDRLYTLPCLLDSDVRGLELREALIDGGILVELDTAPYHESIGKLIIGGIERVDGFVAVAGSQPGTPLDFAKSVRGEIEAFLGSAGAPEAKRGGKMVGPTMLTDTVEYPVFGGATQVLQASEFDDFARRLVGWLNYSSSGAYEACTAVLRDMYYIYAAEFFNLPYWPQSTRVEFAKAFPNFFTQDVRTALYEKLAQGFNSTLKEVGDAFGERVVVIPPFSALALDRASRREELTIRILELRQEYSSLRENLRGLEVGRREARTLREKKQWVDRRNKLLEEASKVYSQPHTLRIESVVRYIPEIVKPALAPGDPTKYSANLVLQPIDWLMNWWSRRPISMLFDTAKQLLALQDYANSIARIFGNEYLEG